MDKRQYLRNLRAHHSEQLRQNESKLERFRSAIIPADLKAALTELPFLTEPDDVAKAMDLIRDASQDATIRTLALQKVANALINDPALPAVCLQILQDAANATGLRVAALNVLMTLSFSSRQFAAARAEYIAALRTLIDDQDQQVRAMAVEQLAVYKDEYVQRRLLEELRTNNSTIIPRAKAIQLLGYDIHAEHYPIVREVLISDDATETEKIEAIHVLANDPSSANLLADLMTDKKQQKEIRLSSAAALQAANPQQFVQVAKQVIMDQKEDKDLKVITLNGIMQHADAPFMQHDPEFITHVTNMKAHSLSPALKKAAKRYVDHIKKRDSSN